jgi:two-component system phosphate regulon sensor histidine kinase PhoR
VPQTLWREVWILAGITLVSLALGALTGRYFIVAAVGFGLYIVSHLRQLAALRRWLLQRDTRDVPEAEGLWGDVFNEIRKLMKTTGQREDALAGMVNRLQSVAAAMPDAVVILTQRGEIEWANTTARTLLGLSYPSDAGMRISNLLRDPELAAYLEHGEHGEPFEMDSPEQVDRRVSIQAIPYGTDQKLIIARDITRLARLEQMRRTFVANVSHELRTPITVLAGYVETLSQMGSVPPEELKKHLATMQEQATRMQRLVDDLLTLSKLETAAPRRHDETVDVPALLAGLREQAEVLSGGRHTITLDAQAHLGLRGAREELHSAFMNLINNAVRYTPPGGRIALAWRAGGEGGAHFSVTDDGEGIAPEHIPRLTERFYRVDSARSRASGGTGLGLSIVKHVLMRHDAHLEIESAPGAGSVFTCVFPAARVVRPPACVASAAV